MNVALILGYGVFQSSNQTYVDYLEEALKIILTRQIDLIVPCGGYTSNSILFQVIL